MRFYTYDTSVVVSRTLSRLPDGSLWSAVVLMELMASANDDSQRKVFEKLSKDYERDNSLIVPNVDDWTLASKILFRLTQARRRAQGGKLLRLKPGASQRMALDVLTAVSARRWNSTVVVENWSDFKAIQHYCITNHPRQRFLRTAVSDPFYFIPPIKISISPCGTSRSSVTSVPRASNFAALTMRP